LTFPLSRKSSDIEIIPLNSHLSKPSLCLRGKVGDGGKLGTGKVGDGDDLMRFSHGYGISNSAISFSPRATARLIADCPTPRSFPTGELRGRGSLGDGHEIMRFHLRLCMIRKRCRTVSRGETNKKPIAIKQISFLIDVLSKKRAYRWSW
jgi:hypothetical protein